LDKAIHLSLIQNDTTMGKYSNCAQLSAKQLICIGSLMKQTKVNGCIMPAFFRAHSITQVCNGTAENHGNQLMQSLLGKCAGEFIQLST